jgi:hypothetical protein
VPVKEGHVPLPAYWQVDSVTLSQLIIYSSALTASSSAFTFAI